MALAESSSSVVRRVCQCPCGCPANVNVQTFTIAGSFLCCRQCSDDHLDVLMAMPQCSLCEQLRQLTPARCCPTHGNEYGIVLPNDILTLTPDQLAEQLAILRQQREESGIASRHRSRSSTRTEPQPIVTASDAVIAIARGQVTVEQVLAMVAEGKFTMEEVQEALG